MDHYSSKSYKNNSGVPQGSILGPSPFYLYMTPLGNFSRRGCINYSSYANITQLYIAMSNVNSLAYRCASLWPSTTMSSSAGASSTSPSPSSNLCHGMNVRWSRTRPVHVRNRNWLGGTTFHDLFSVRTQSFSFRKLLFFPFTCPVNYDCYDFVHSRGPRV